MKKQWGVAAAALVIGDVTPEGMFPTPPVLVVEFVVPRVLIMLGVGHSLLLSLDTSTYYVCIVVGGAQTSDKDSTFCAIPEILEVSGCEGAKRVSRAI